MKLKTKFLIFLVVIFGCLFLSTNSIKAKGVNKYDSFLEGLKDFDIKMNVLNDSKDSKWKDDSSTDFAKSIDSFKAIEPIMTEVLPTLKGEYYTYCQIKNKVKEFLRTSLKKDGGKAKGGKTNFLQLSYDMERSEVNRRLGAQRSKTKWGQFSEMEHKIGGYCKKFQTSMKSPLLKSYLELLKKVTKHASADYKAKQSANDFTQGVKYITINCRGFIDFFVNFACDQNNFKAASKALKKGMKASVEADKLRAIGTFVDKMYASMRDNKMMAR